MQERPLILVVDDEEPIVDAIEAWLSMAGYSVSIARKGSDAIEKSRHKPPAVALVDLLLDDMPGLAVINEIRRFSPHTECIVITGQAPEKSAVAATEVSAYSYVMKPCNSDHLLLTIRRALEHGRTRKALAEAETLLTELLEAMPAAVLILDRDRRILCLNKRASILLGSDTGEHVDTCLADRLPAGQAAELRESFTAVLRSGETVAFDLSIVGKNRSVRIQPLTGEPHPTGRMIVTIEDA